MLIGCMCEECTTQPENAPKHILHRQVVRSKSERRVTREAVQVPSEPRRRSRGPTWNCNHWSASTRSFGHSLDVRFRGWYRQVNVNCQRNYIHISSEQAFDPTRQRSTKPGLRPGFLASQTRAMKLPTRFPGKQYAILSPTIHQSRAASQALPWAQVLQSMTPDSTYHHRTSVRKWYSTMNSEFCSRLASTVL